MTLHAHIDHVAVLVASLAVARERVETLFDVHLGPADEFPDDGTRELYVGSDEETARLLLIEPLEHRGPYARALELRGPGLHHIGILVPDLESFVLGTHGSGWYLHPRSIATMRDQRTAWLARPGAGMLIEVRQAGPQPERALFTSRIEVPLAGLERLLQIMPDTGARVCASTDDDVWLTVRGRRTRLAAIVE